MCALNAKETNPACKALFDRLVARGKNKKLAVIAVCNKLLKQVFGVVKSGEMFDRNYLQKNSLVYLVFCTVRPMWVLCLRCAIREEQKRYKE